jgi:hypothetical protein
MGRYVSSAMRAVSWRTARCLAAAAPSAFCVFPPPPIPGRKLVFARSSNGTCLCVPTATLPGFHTRYVQIYHFSYISRFLILLRATSACLLPRSVRNLARQQQQACRSASSKRSFIELQGPALATSLGFACGQNALVLHFRFSHGASVWLSLHLQSVTRPLIAILFLAIQLTS